jgi:hypothetical protein
MLFLLWWQVRLTLLDHSLSRHQRERNESGEARWYGPNDDVSHSLHTGSPSEDMNSSTRAIGGSRPA